MTELGPTDEYADLLSGLKARIEAARLAAARSVNREMLALYWDIGAAINSARRQRPWGDRVVEALSLDLRAAFPGSRGFSPRNLWDMGRFQETYSSPDFLRQAVAELGKLVFIKDRPEAAPYSEQPNEFLRQLVAEIPWGHHLVLLSKVDDPAAQLYYISASARFGWSRNVLLNQIKAGAYERSLAEGKSHNFDETLPEHLAEQAEEALKSSYNLEFLGIARYPSGWFVRIFASINCWLKRGSKG